MEWTISVSDGLKGPCAEEGIETLKNLGFGTVDGAERMEYLHGRVVTVLAVGGERILKCSIKEMSGQIFRSLRALTKHGTRRVTHVFR